MPFLIRSVNGQRTVFTNKADLEKARQTDIQGCEEPKIQNIQQPNIQDTQRTTTQDIERPIIQGAQQPSTQDIQLTNIQDMHQTNVQDFQSINIREELIEALKGLTIKLEIRLSDVIDENNLSSVPNATSESDSCERGSTSDESRGSQTLDGCSKSETSSQSDQSGTTDSEAILQSKRPPILVDDFKSTIRPISSLKPDPNKISSTVNFTPLQVLKKQVEKHVSASQNGGIKSKPKQPIWVEPIGAQSKPKVKSPDPGKGLPNDKGDEKSASNGLSCPPTRESNPTKMWGKVEVGSVISSCRLSDDGQFSYISYNNDAVLEIDRLMEDMATEIEILPRMREVCVHDFVFAKSHDEDIWYRATVSEVNGTKVSVYYVDWGISEVLPLDRIRYLSISGLSLAVKPACAIKVKFTNDADLIEPLLDGSFEAKVISYNKSDDLYIMTVVT